MTDLFIFLTVFFTYPNRQGMQADQNMMLHGKIIFFIMLGLVQSFVAGTEAQCMYAQRCMVMHACLLWLKLMILHVMYVNDDMMLICCCHDYNIAVKKERKKVVAMATAAEDDNGRVMSLTALQEDDVGGGIFVI